MMTISSTFTHTITRPLLKRSAIQPPNMENSRNGTAKYMPASETRRSSFSFGHCWAITMKMTSCLSTLSENAP